MSSTSLIKYDAMCRAISEAHKVDEVKSIRDKALALETYAKQARNVAAENRATEIRIRAERKVGLLLKEMLKNGERHSGHGDQKTESQRATPKIKDFGITKSQSSRWQKLAGIDEEEFESNFYDVRKNKPTTSGVLKNAPPKGPQKSPEQTKREDVALWLWGRLRAIIAQKEGLDGITLNQVARTMTKLMRQDCIDNIPTVRRWLNDLLKELKNVDSVNSNSQPD